MKKKTLYDTDKRWKETMTRLDKIIEQFKKDHKKFLEERVRNI